MAQKLYNEDDINNIGKAIQRKLDDYETRYRVRDMAPAIDSIPLFTTPELKEVNFWDIDGTPLYSYTLEEAAQLEELPKPPSHDELGLEFVEWNWSLDDIKCAGYPCDIGPIFNTVDRKTHIIVELPDQGPYTYPYPVNFRCRALEANVATIDWGDGSSPDYITSTTDQYYYHAYSEPGEYNITIDSKSTEVVFGNHDWYGSSQRTFGLWGLIPSISIFKKIFFGDNVRLINSAFYYDYIELITLPPYLNNSTLFNNVALTSRFRSVVFPKHFTGTFWRGDQCPVGSDIRMTKVISLPIDFVMVDNPVPGWYLANDSFSGFSLTGNMSGNAQVGIHFDAWRIWGFKYLVYGGKYGGRITNIYEINRGAELFAQAIIRGDGSDVYFPNLTRIPSYIDQLGNSYLFTNNPSMVRFHIASDIFPAIQRFVPHVARTGYAGSIQPFQMPFLEGKRKYMALRELTQRLPYMDNITMWNSQDFTLYGSTYRQYNPIGVGNVNSLGTAALVEIFPQEKFTVAGGGQYSTYDEYYQTANYSTTGSGTDRDNGYDSSGNGGTYVPNNNTNSSNGRFLQFVGSNSANGDGNALSIYRGTEYYPYSELQISSINNSTNTRTNFPQPMCTPYEISSLEVTYPYKEGGYSELSIVKYNNNIIPSNLLQDKTITVDCSTWKVTCHITFEIKDGKITITNIDGTQHGEGAAFILPFDNPAFIPAQSYIWLNNNFNGRSYWWQTSSFINPAGTVIINFDYNKPSTNWEIGSANVDFTLSGLRFVTGTLQVGDSWGPFWGGEYKYAYGTNYQSNAADTTKLMSSMNIFGPRGNRYQEHQEQTYVVSVSGFYGGTYNFITGELSNIYDASGDPLDAPITSTVTPPTITLYSDSDTNFHANGNTLYGKYHPNFDLPLLRPYYKKNKYIVSKRVAAVKYTEADLEQTNYKGPIKQLMTILPYNSSGYTEIKLQHDNGRYLDHIYISPDNPMEQNGIRIWTSMDNNIHIDGTATANTTFEFDLSENYNKHVPKQYDNLAHNTLFMNNSFLNSNVYVCFYDGSTKIANTNFGFGYYYAAWDNPFEDVDITKMTLYIPSGTVLSDQTIRPEIVVSNYGNDLRWIEADMPVIDGEIAYTESSSDTYCDVLTVPLTNLAEPFYGGTYDWITHKLVSAFTSSGSVIPEADRTITELVSQDINENIFWPNNVFTDLTNSNCTLWMIDSTDPADWPED